MTPTVITKKCYSSLLRQMIKKKSVHHFASTVLKSDKFYKYHRIPLVSFSSYRILRWSSLDVLTIYSMMALLTGNWIADILIILIGVFTVVYSILKRQYSYWERKGFKTHPEFGYIFGHFKKLFIDRMSFADFINQLYKSTNDPFIGIYGILRPMLFVRDPELIQSILIKDFSHFTDRKWIFMDCPFFILSQYEFLIMIYKKKVGCTLMKKSIHYLQIYFHYPGTDGKVYAQN